jgi:hypothetical protein
MTRVRRVRVAFQPEVTFQCFLHARADQQLVEILEVDTAAIRG